MVEGNSNNNKNRLSFWRETWSALKTSIDKMWPSVLGFAVVIAAAQYILVISTGDDETFKQYHDHPELLHQHPEMAKQYLAYTLGRLGNVLLAGLLLMAAQCAAFYVFTVSYLRLAVKNNPPQFSLGHFYYWIKKVSWKYTRPILWLLLPIIGFFFYIRSTVRYELVTPLAILGRGPELRRSWDMTEGNWWRIFLGHLALSFLIWLGVLAVSIIPLIVLAIIAGHNGPLFLGAVTLIKGGGASLAGMGSAIYACTVYRILLQEQRQAAPTPLQSPVQQ